MQYEWDEGKRAINVRKHGIDFEDCPAVLEEPCAMTTEDRGDYGEQRFLTVGWLREHLVVVAHSRDGDGIRIISARKASKHEQRIYFKQVHRH